MKAVLCPVCNGKCQVIPPWDVWDGKTLIDCRGCGGKGWVEVNEINQMYIFPSYEKSETQSMPDYSKCPTCGGDRNSPGLTSCPMGSHYGSYREA